MKVGIAFDLQPVSGPPADGPDDRFEEFDKPETVDAIAEVIRGEGHEVVLLGDGRPFLERVLADPPDFVWNIAEGEGVGRCREARVPAALEMLGIPYSGSDPLTLAACLDKGMTRRLLQHPVRMPWGRVYPPLDGDLEDHRLRLSAISHELGDTIYGKDYDFRKHPLILKPSFEGSSKGIRDRVVARSEADFVAIWERLVRDYHQPILVEEFIAGTELTVGVCETTGRYPSVEILGVMKILPRTPDPDFVYSLEVKRDWRNQVTYEAPARLAPEILNQIQMMAMLAFFQLECHDFARIDFRLSPDGTLYFIEANPLPGLAPVTSDLVILAEGYGLSHADLIRKLFRISLERNGLLR